MMYKICKFERIDYISYGKFTRYVLAKKGNCQILARISPYIVNITMVIFLLYEMTQNAKAGVDMFEHLLKYYYGVEQMLPVYVVAVPCFLSVMTVPKLPMLLCFSITGFISLLILTIYQLMSCLEEMSKHDVEIVWFGKASEIPGLANCLLSGMASFPVVSFSFFMSFHVSLKTVPLLQILAIEKEMTVPENFTKRFGIGNVCMVISNVSAILFGILGYLTYGNSIKPEIYENFEDSGLDDNNIYGIIELIAVFCTFPLFGYGVMSIVYHELILPNLRLKEPIFVEQALRILITLVAGDFF